MTEPAEQDLPRAPDFYIVGHHKSGTTALYEMLRRHPQIFMSAVKEPRFLAADLRALVPSAAHQPQTMAEYLELFRAAPPGQLTGEASPSYLRSAVAAREIARLRPDARIIAILREPASFVRSMHLQMVQEHVEQEQDLGRAFANEEVERSGRRVLRYSDHVRYVEQLRRYEDVFPPEQVLVLIYDDFRAENEATVRKVLRFLGVDDSAEVEAVEANPTVRVRSMRLDSIVRRLSGGRTPVSRAARALAQRLPASVRRGALQGLRRGVVYGRPDEFDPALERTLKRRFKGEVEALSRHLDRDLLGLWGYRDL
jgi:Sulfotransferase family